MTWVDRPLCRWLLRGAGAGLLAIAYLICTRLAIIGPRDVGHEPLIVYLGSLLAFVCGSGGGASLFYGHHLFDRVHVSELWATQSSVTETDWGH